MSHRDRHRDADYFLRYVAALEQSIATLRKRDCPEDRVLIFERRIGMVFARYSLGANREEICESVHGIYDDVPDALFEFRLALGTTIPLASLGYLCNVQCRKERIFEYMVLPARNSHRNRIVDLFLGSESAWDHDAYEGNDLPKTVSKYFWAVANAARAGSPEASELLVSFVRTHWYRSWKAAGWWGSHENTVHDVYSGYWCYEGAALAKMFDLDDSALRDHKYYPYDLVHH